MRLGGETKRREEEKGEREREERERERSVGVKRKERERYIAGVTSTASNLSNTSPLAAC